MTANYFMFSGQVPSPQVLQSCECHGNNAMVSYNYHVNKCHMLASLSQKSHGGTISSTSKIEVISISYFPSGCNKSPGRSNFRTEEFI